MVLRGPVDDGEDGAQATESDGTPQQIQSSPASAFGWALDAFLHSSSSSSSSASATDMIGQPEGEQCRDGTVNDDGSGGRSSNNDDDDDTTTNATVLATALRQSMLHALRRGMATVRTMPNTIAGIPASLLGVRTSPSLFFHFLVLRQRRRHAIASERSLLSRASEQLVMLWFCRAFFVRLQDDELIPESEALDTATFGDAFLSPQDFVYVCAAGCAVLC